MLLVNLILSLSLLGFNPGAIPGNLYPTIRQESEQNNYLLEETLSVIESSLRSKDEVTEPILQSGDLGNFQYSILKDLEKKKPVPALVSEPRALPSTKQNPVVNKVTTAPPAENLPDFETFITQKCSQYGCNPSQLIRIMYCESGGRSNAINPAGPYIGLFQFLSSTFYANAKFIPSANINNPYHQIEVTAKMFANGQAWQWGCK
ncbi:MAG: transglycosylase SLT domain-containing protein [Patescibacteria group bacterium]